MPVQLTYPGVYIEEIPSGVRTITGVATSITAFIGRTKRGPVNEPITINNFGDFERNFGSLWVESTMSYAIRDFYLNGGRQAIIVRLFCPQYTDDDEKNAARNAAQAVAAAATTAAGQTGATAETVAQAAKTKADTYSNEPEKSAAQYVAAAALKAAQEQNADASKVATAASDAVAGATPLTKAQLSVDTLLLEAANEGAWGNKLTATIDHNVKGDNAANLFNLTVEDNGTGLIELFRNVSVLADSTRRIDNVLKQESMLVHVRGNLPTARPAPATGKVEEAGKASDGWKLNNALIAGAESEKTGIYALQKADLFNLLCIPPYTLEEDIEGDLWSKAISYCDLRRAMVLIDAPISWKSKTEAKSGISTSVGDAHKNAAIYFPRLRMPNPERDNQFEDFAPCGAIAGVISRTDAQRGVWKAPAGLDATLIGVPALSVSLTDDENGELNPLGINCLRNKPPAGRIIWGARTRVGDDRLASEWKYLPVRRMALFLEESLYRGTQWVVFEPNDEPLWSQIRLNVGSFMHNLFRQGAFQGQTPRDAYFVKCDSETTTQNDINLGIVNIIVGFAPLKPAEFVVIKIQQMAGQIEV